MSVLTGRANQSRRLVSGLMIAAVTALALAPKALASTGVMVDTATGRAAAYSVTATCRAVVGVSTTPGGPMTYVIEGDAWASPVHLAAGTWLTCIVRDASTGREYGRVHHSAPGGHAHAGGTYVVPHGGNAEICSEAGATFIDGTVVIGGSC